MFARVSVCVCVRTCVCICLCVYWGSCTGSKGGGGGGGLGKRCLSIGRQWPSLLYFKRLPVAPELQKSRELHRHSLTHSLTHIPSSPVEKYPGVVFRGGSVRVHRFDRVSTSADILQYDYMHLSGSCQEKEMLMGLCDSHCLSLPQNQICFRV